MDHFTSEYIKDVSRILSEKSLTNLSYGDDGVTFICHAAEDSDVLSNALSYAEIQDEFQKFGLTNFSGSAFLEHSARKQAKLSMLRRFMFLDFIAMYLEDEEAQRNQEQRKEG